MAKGKFEKWLSPDGLLLLAAWARDGLSDEQIAHNCGCASSTFYEWKLRFPEIAEALKKNKEIADIEVENALHRRAVGYEVTEESVEIAGNRRKVKQSVRHIAPDVAACIVWLKNRKPDKWRDRPLPPPPPDAGSDPLTDAIRAALGKPPDDGEGDE